MEFVVIDPKTRIVQESMITDLKEYSGLTENLTKIRISYAFFELASRWHEQAAKYSEDHMRYYEEQANLYLFDLTRYQINMIKNTEEIIS